MTDHTPTPRKCQAHFGLNDLVCPHGCYEHCIVADPRKVNSEIAELNRQLSAYQQAELPEGDAMIIEAAKELTPLLEQGWDEYDDSADQVAGSQACDKLIAAVRKQYPAPPASEQNADKT